MSRKRSRRTAQADPPDGATGDPARLWQSAVAAYQRGDPTRVRRDLKPLLKHPAADGTTFLLAGLVEAQLENWPHAERYLRQATDLSPEQVEGWLMLGNVLYGQGRLEEATRAYRGATHHAPDNAQVWNNLAVACEDMGHTREALDYYEHALEIEPHHPQALRGRAPVLARLRWFDRAREAYEDLLARFPEDRMLRLDFARFLEQANRPEEAARYLPDPGTARDKAEDATAEYLRAQLMIRTGDLEAALPGLQSARERTGEDFLSYSEGTILDRLGRYDEAMAAFQRANAARASQPSYRRQLAQSLDAYLQGKLDTGVQPAGPPAATARADPVFVTGLPRSGTTLLDRMLAGHPRVQVLEELEGLHVAETALADGEDVEEARRVYWAFIERHVQLQADAVIVDKNPMHVMHLDVLPRLFPGARVLLALRHPYDAALSCYMQDFDPGPVTARFVDLAATGDVCAKLLRLMRQFEQSRPAQATRVRYEDLVEDFRSEIGRVLEGMGLTWHEEIENYAALAARSAPIMTASYDQVTRGLYKSAVERWRHYEQWLGPFHETLEPLLGDFGYTR